MVRCINKEKILEKIFNKDLSFLQSIPIISLKPKVKDLDLENELFVKILKEDKIEEVFCNFFINNKYETILYKEPSKVSSETKEIVNTLKDLAIKSHYEYNEYDLAKVLRADLSIKLFQKLKRKYFVSSAIYLSLLTPNEYQNTYPKSVSSLSHKDFLEEKEIIGFVLNRISKMKISYLLEITPLLGKRRKKSIKVETDVYLGRLYYYNKEDIF